jgi:hypothetical protein
VEVLRWTGLGLIRTASIAIPDANGNTGAYGPIDATIADMNGDGYGDVAVTHMRDGRVLFLAGGAPAAPAIGSSSHPDPKGWGPSSLSASFTAGPDLDGIRGYQAVLDENPVGAPAADATELSNPVFTVSGLSTGDHYLHVRAVDIAGKQGAVATYRVGVTAALSEQNAYNFPNPTRDGRTTIRFALAAPAAVELRLLDENGLLVWSRDLSEAQTLGGVNYIEWDGRREDGRVAANGGYILKIRSGSTLVIKKVAVAR